MATLTDFNKRINWFESYRLKNSAAYVMSLTRLLRMVTRSLPIELTTVNERG
jgi:hypothetical protein